VDDEIATRPANVLITSRGFPLLLKTGTKDIGKKLVSTIDTAGEIIANCLLWVAGR
jgi:hypothetical protein